MSEYTPQSTDRVNENINPRVTNVVLEDSVTMTLSSTSGGYSVYVATVTLPADTRYAGLDIEAWVRYQIAGGANPVKYRKLPYNEFTVATLVENAFISVVSPTKSATYDINFSYQTSNTMNVSPVVYYRILSSRISSTGLSFV